MAVGIAMLMAGIIDAISPVDAVGSEFIDRAPGWLVDLAKSWFGTSDKTALRVGIFAVLTIAALAVGAVGRRWRSVGVIGIVGFGVIGMAAAVHRPNETASAATPSLIGAVVGVASIWYLLTVIRARPDAIEMPTRSRVPLGWDRRRFLAASGTAAAVAVAAGAIARADEHRRVSDLRESAPDSLPPSASAPPTVPAAAATDFEIGTPYITPNDGFYRIDTALSFPRIDVDKHSIDITGMVRSPLTITYAELLARPQVERTITLACVSNDVGGDLIGNAVWQGVLLADVLDEAGVDPGAEQVFSTSVDGFTTGFPVSVALDGRDAMIAIGMNGEPLPLEHGFPVRLVVPGLYGYVSATKWLKTIELTTWDASSGYWIPRGWSRDGPIKTQSRIDVPRRGDEVRAGRTNIAGVAWAQHRGIAKVEVRVDDGAWREARLGEVVGDDTWCQWLIDWDATAGRHQLQVRATDKTGETQTEVVTDVAPNGATGWHTRRVTVS